MVEVQEYSTQKTIQMAEIAIQKIAPTMSDLLKGMCMWLKEKANQPKRGEQSLKSLLQYGETLSNIPLNSENIKTFTSIARKHGVDFALAADETKTPPHHTVYFKAKDTETMSAAFNEYLASEIHKGKSEKQGFKERLNDAKSKVKVQDKEKNQRREVEGR
jgi:cystathionine beta-lyase/cystathionine gamma-synthase